MSVHRRGDKWRVRYLDAGQHRSRAFDLKADAQAFEGQGGPPPQAGARGGPRFVYVVHAGDLLKVGMTNDVDKRVAAIQAHCPIPIELVRVIETKHAARLEKCLHHDLADFRAHGEWFTDADRLLAAFATVTDAQLLAEVAL